MKPSTFLSPLFASLVFTLCLFISPEAAAQDQSTNKLVVKTRTINQQVEIRWAPTDHLLWSLANRQGYRLERKSQEGTWETLLDRTPYSVQEFKSRLDTTNAHVATAAQTLHGKPKTVITGTDPFAEAKALEEEQKMRHMFALLAADYNTDAADALALRYVDKDIIVGANILYRLYVRAGEKQPALPDTAYFLVNTNRTYQARKVKKAFATPEADGIILKWSKSDNNDFFSGYFIERSDNNGKGFQRLNNSPLLTSDHEDFETFNNFHIYADKTAQTGISYQYRIIGVTPFGDEGLPSDIITSQLMDLAGPPPPKEIKAIDIGDNKMEISWIADVSSDDHNGFIIARAAHPTGPFYPLNEKPLSTKVRKFTDENPIPIKANYYLVYAVDKLDNRNGSSIAMAQWYDDTPPAKPTDLAGFADTSGIVTLAWTWGSDPDLLGYRVYWSNGPDREFYQLTDKPVEGSIYVDSINLQTLTETIYYKVVAVDYNMNPSTPSDPIPLKRPDLIPPAAPLLTDFQSFPDSIQLRWQPSPSEDVVAYRLLRKEVGAEKYDLLQNILNPTQTRFTDTRIEAGKKYEYAIVAIDDARLYSEISSPIKAAALRGAKRPAIQDLSGKVDESNGTFILNWTYEAPDSYQFAIYRKTDDQNWEQLAWIDSENSSFTDKQLFRAETGFSYAVKVIYDDGGESPFSNEVQLNIKE
ncbi:MAG: hypothetical protein GYB31_04330 [Bacteroidetes bacterium]|nr:hypothetical protein [Bacteroidota bacterium]